MFARTPKRGGIAQLGERLNGIQEVSGSIPLISTIKNHSEPARVRFFYACLFLAPLAYLALTDFKPLTAC